MKSLFNRFSKLKIANNDLSNQLPSWIGDRTYSCSSIVSIFISSQSSQLDVIFNNEQLTIGENSQHLIFRLKNSLFFCLCFFLARQIIHMTNQIHDVIYVIDGASVGVHIIEDDLYSRDQKKAFTIQNHEGINKEGVEASKIHSVGPAGVQYNRLITNERCSLIEVLLYSVLLWKHSEKFSRNS
jgi:hypothetical protein